ncbi:ATP-binding protein [Isoptericola sp. b441]|uniref:ATP-binding protein n=1 Tax=Actinotalea lenta TaxID=3064654 RepID=A0ABT9D6V0_9CELL|nr:MULTISPECIES: ATP-binding protein [unclassified Isoptericola]MDO8106561.1 ATP-binding protein [Isoptericola sp. b441]MDO8121731.1 ATP-binding protein [Isoptericola sp. b490]
MAGEPQRRPSSGRPLRLVGESTTPRGRLGPVCEDGSSDASLVLPGHRQSVAVGRHWVVRTSAERGVVGMANQVVELLSSELLSNAVLHGAGGHAIGVQLRHTAATVRVAVSDGGDRAPVVLDQDLAAVNGRGMAIVEAMSTRWGIESRDEGGKTVWFELDLTEF